MAKPRKRLIEEVDSEDSPIETANTRRKTEESTNSDTSYVSAAAAIFSDESDGEDTVQTDIGSGSELSLSSEESSSESDASNEEESEGDDEREDEITNVRPGTKPLISKVTVTGAGLMQRLQSLLPAIEKANQELEEEREAGTLGKRDLENVEEGEGSYIEMDLGLGVLEEKKPNNENEDIISSENEDPDTEDEQREEDIIGRLMGQKSKRKPISVREIGNG